MLFERGEVYNFGELSRLRYNARGAGPFPRGLVIVRRRRKRFGHDSTDRIQHDPDKTPLSHASARVIILVTRNRINLHRRQVRDRLTGASNTSPLFLLFTQNNL